MKALEKKRDVSFLETTQFQLAEVYVPLAHILSMVVEIFISYQTESVGIMRFFPNHLIHLHCLSLSSPRQGFHFFFTITTSIRYSVRQKKKKKKIL